MLFLRNCRNLWRSMQRFSKLPGSCQLIVFAYNAERFAIAFLFEFVSNGKRFAVATIAFARNGKNSATAFVLFLLLLLARAFGQFYHNVLLMLIQIVTQEVCDQFQAFCIEHTKKTFRYKYSCYCYLRRVCPMRCHVLQFIQGNQYSQNLKKNKRQ